MRILRLFRRSVPLLSTAGIYIASVGCLFIGELVFANSASRDSFAIYQLVRNGLPVVVALGLLGIDQSLMREVAIRSRLPKNGYWIFPSLIVLTLSGVGLATVLVCIGGLEKLLAPGIVMGGVGLGLLYIISAFAKGVNAPAVASIYLQGYRVFLGIGLVIIASLGGYFASSTNAIAILVIVLVVMTFSGIIWYGRREHSWIITHGEAKSIRKLGYAFSIPMLAVALVDWVDQFLVASFYGASLAGEYGIAKLLTLFPVLSIASILSFVALPFAIKALPKVTAKKLKKVYAIAALVSLIIALTVAYFAELIMLNIFSIKLHPSFSLFLALASAARLYYVVPSAIVGAQGSHKALTVVGISGMVGLLALVGFAWLGTVTHPDFGLSWVACGLFVANFMRSCVSTVQSFVFIRKHPLHSAS